MNAWNVNDNKIKEVYHHKPIPINSSFTEFLYKQVHKLIAKYQDVQDLAHWPLRWLRYLVA